MAVLTAAALAVVGFLAYQANAGTPVAAPPKAAPSTGPSKAAGGPKKPAVAELPVPSGTGERVVYSLGQKRVWLVAADGAVVRTYPVTPSTVSPRPGEYRVSTRSKSIPGSDGVLVEHVVRFTSVDEIVIGFSAAVNGSTAPPAKKARTGGIRSSRKDGAALWTFATVGVPVVVVA
ncbi:hypothetical protein SRB5_66580 [Streptomyces sp. RB5]|uniref:L,D-transpeptidase n=1 Tax=Streptomyces smaragdinus TaxID=2585196 RepID=A0A7K0CSM0_9ACTN|nr:hypothetical protein [Streptomyces smaragdinus]